MPRFKVFQDVVLFALETDVHLVFKVEQRFGVVVGSEFDFVANFSADVQLNALVKIKRRDTPLAFRDSRVLGVGDVDAKREFRRSLWLDFDFVASENRLKQLAVHGQFWSEGAFRFVIFGLEVCPIFSQVAGDVVVEVFVKRQVRRRPVQQGVADALLDAIQPGGFVENYLVIEVLRPCKIKACWAFRRVELVLPSEREGQDDGQRVVRRILCGLSPHA